MPLYWSCLIYIVRWKTPIGSLTTPINIINGLALWDISSNVRCTSTDHVPWSNIGQNLLEITPKLELLWCIFLETAHDMATSDSTGLGCTLDQQGFKRYIFIMIVSCSCLPPRFPEVQQDSLSNPLNGDVYFPPHIRLPDTNASNTKRLISNLTGTYPIRVYRKCKFPDVLSCSAIHLHIPVLVTIKMLEEIATLKVLVGMHYGFELCHGHNALVLGAFDLVLVNILKDPLNKG